MFNRVFHYFHHPFWGFSPYFWKHPGEFPYVFLREFFPVKHSVHDFFGLGGHKPGSPLNFLAERSNLRVVSW